MDTSEVVATTDAGRQWVPVPAQSGSIAGLIQDGESLSFPTEGTGYLLVGVLKRRDLTGHGATVMYNTTDGGRSWVAGAHHPIRLHPAARCGNGSDRPPPGHA
ncbi:MAG: hypothetical protein M0Z54_12935 [Thermaerobacter sp.]|nr:hypothetical protein [Thermaerobacter sp.]